MPLAAPCGVRAVAAVPACGLLAGCAIGLYAPDGPRAIPLGVLMASLGLAVWALRNGRVQGLAGAVLIGCGAAGALLATGAWQAAWRPSLRVAFESIAREGHDDQARGDGASGLAEDVRASVVLVGVLREDGARTPGGGVSLNLAVQWVGRVASRRTDAAINPVEGGALLTVVGDAASVRLHEWRRGRTIRAPAQLRRPSRYLDPGVPDQERALARRGVSLVGTVKSAELVDLVSRGSPQAEAAAAARAFARRALARAVGRWNSRSAGIVTAILIGDRTGLDPDVERRLQEAGTYHVIAISGGNIAILAGLALAGFRVAGLLGRGAMLSAICSLLAYGYLVGGGASVDRATLMATVYLAGRAVDLRGPPLNALALVAGLLVVASPLAIADPGFLLTFGATAAILFIASTVPIGRLTPHVPRLVSQIVALFLASLAAEAALLPISATLFSRVTFAGLVLNFAAIPLMAVAQMAGMIVVATFVPVPLLASAAGWVAHLGAEGLVRTADLVELVPAVTWRVAPASGIVISLYYVGLVVGLALWRRRVQPSETGESRVARIGRRAAGGVAAAAAVWIVWQPWALLGSQGDGRLHVTFIDVGQGDAAFVRFPHGSTMLVDAGGLPAGATFDVGDRVVGAVIRAHGRPRLGTVVLTHGDADHIGGARSSIREFRPWDVWEGIPVPPAKPLQALKDAAGLSRSRWTRVQTNDEIVIDDVRVVVRHPDRPDWERQDVRNDDSVVIELLWRDVSVVLTGDIGSEVEEHLVPSFEPSRLRVLKVPHHGSLTSSSEAFVKALAPRVAVVSVGRGNAFGHPARSVLKRYEDIGARIFRTDADGAVMVDTDGTSLDVHTFTGRRLSVHPDRASRDAAVSPSPAPTPPRGPRASSRAFGVPTR